jgi:hypothetical protein
MFKGNYDISLSNYSCILFSLIHWDQDHGCGVKCHFSTTELYTQIYDDTLARCLRKEDVYIILD